MFLYILKLARNLKRLFGSRYMSIFICLLALVATGAEAVMSQQYIDELTIDKTIHTLTEQHPNANREMSERGIRQVAKMWLERDGSKDEFVTFCADNFIADEETRLATLGRYEEYLSSLSGHFAELGRDLSWNLDVTTGDILPIDYSFASFSPGAHLNEDFFISKIGFIALLNYQQHQLVEKLKFGSDWSRIKWVETRLADWFSARVPSGISQETSLAYTAATAYISSYNIHMHHLLDEKGERSFPAGMKLITHWNLRDELKAQYSDPEGLDRQRMIYKVMMRIINQDIPEVVINNPGVDWNPVSNEVTVSGVKDNPLPSHWQPNGEAGSKVDNSAEPNLRYQHLLNVFKAERKADQYYPDHPTVIKRRFDLGREMPEAEVATLLKTVVGAPILKDVAALIEKRLGRKLEPFDIWYDGFKARGSIDNDKLDQIVGDKYPTVESFQNELPVILGKLGFDKNTASFLVEHIVVDPSRGAGHAMGPGLPDDKARLRTRIPETGMDYKGYNIAIHEFGHNVEQLFSLHKVDRKFMRGVPNTAFTEGFAFVFQARDLELLGLEETDSTSELLRTLDVLWSTYEIGGVALLDMAIWNWMYDHPDATAEELNAGVVGLARRIWNEYYAPLFGDKDCELLAVYSHLIEYGLYVPNYPIGHIIAHQIEKYMKDKNLATEMERMCAIGSVTPDLWMKQAVGDAISAQPLLDDAKMALEQLTK